MIELEIQGLAQSREGLLIEVGRLVMAHGFTLQRQRLVSDHHGILLTVIVRGPVRRRSALQAALDACERFISVHMMPWVEGAPTAHFAASRPRAAYTPPPAPESAAPAVSASTPAPAQAPAAPLPGEIIDKDDYAATAAPTASPARAPEPEFAFIEPAPRPAAPPTATAVTAPFVDLQPLPADEAAVDKLTGALEYDYPDIAAQLLVLQRSVAEAASESSLTLAGQRTGRWVGRREYPWGDALDLDKAIARIGVPALRALVAVDQRGSQLHIHDSPLCDAEGHSGCSFFGGFLEGLLGPAVTPRTLSIFPVCCRSFGADACVLELSCGGDLA